MLTLRALTLWGCVQQHISSRCLHEHRFCMSGVCNNNYLSEPPISQCNVWHYIITLFRPGSSWRLWRQLPPCCWSMPWCPLECSSWHWNFSHGKRRLVLKQKLPCPYNNTAAGLLFTIWASKLFYKKESFLKNNLAWTFWKLSRFDVWFTKKMNNEYCRCVCQLLQKRNRSSVLMWS